jgi:hypothetical protein
MTTYSDTDIVQFKVRVPAEVRQTAKIEAAKRYLTMCDYVAEAVREKAARDATAERSA